MNRENLLRMAEFIANIPQEKFDMEVYMGTNLNGETMPSNDINELDNCGSVGCVIGHCMKLDTLESLNAHTIFDSGINIRVFRFDAWSRNFTGLNPNQSMGAWDWCFSSGWASCDNTPTGASKRIKYLLEHGLPHKFIDHNPNGDLDEFVKLYEIMK